jgi:hypothetical protein
MRIEYAYPDAIFINRLEADAEGSSWTIASRPASGGPEQRFASYALARASCAGLKFAF